MYFMRNKSDAPQMLKRYIADVSTFLHANGVKAPLTVRSDNGGEYMSEEWADICVDNGMRHQTSTPYNPRQNGISESTNRTILRVARAVHSQSGVKHSM